MGVARLVFRAVVLRVCVVFLVVMRVVVDGRWVVQNVSVYFFLDVVLVLERCGFGHRVSLLWFDAGCEFVFVVRVDHADVPGVVLVHVPFDDG